MARATKLSLLIVGLVKIIVLAIFALIYLWMFSCIVKKHYFIDTCEIKVPYTSYIVMTYKCQSSIPKIALNSYEALKYIKNQFYCVTICSYIFIIMGEFFHWLGEIYYGKIVELSR